MNRFEKTSNDLTALAPKWSERGHLLAALPKHLADAQEAIKSQQNIDKEMTDLSLIASAWLKSQQQKELLEARLKRFKETAGYPSMASILASPVVVGSTNKEHVMNRFAKAAAFGAMMGKMAAGEAPAAPQPSARDIQIHNARMELQRKGQMVRDAAGGNGAYGTSRGTMKGGVMQPGATFTPQEGQQGQRPLTGAGGQSNTPPVPRGQQPVPPTSSPVIESKTPRRLF